MHRLIVSIFVFFAFCSEAASAHINCTNPAHAESYGPAEFYKDTKFGTVGVTFDKSGESSPRTRLFVPRNCIVAPKSVSSLSVFFNHRNSLESSVGYVSFKLYGIKKGVDNSAGLLKLIRKGAWTRNGESMRAAPWRPPPRPVTIDDYEHFYSGSARTSPNQLSHCGLNNEQCNRFDKTFGPLHGTPSESVNSSWSGRDRMQPTPALDNGNVEYLYHNLQRLTVSRGTASIPKIPPAIVTQKTEHDSIVVSIFSPLNETVEKTIRIIFQGPD